MPGEQKGYPLQYFFLEKSTDRGAWWATAQGVAKSQTQLSTYARGQDVTESHISRRGSLRLNVLRAVGLERAVGQALGGQLHPAAAPSRGSEQASCPHPEARVPSVKDGVTPCLLGHSSRGLLVLSTACSLGSPCPGASQNPDKEAGVGGVGGGGGAGTHPPPSCPP